MKRIFSFLFAIITLVGTTSVFTSCQEDAPEINYTINITVNNDFTEVVNAINNGTMKQEAAIAALTAAINQMNGDQTAKLQALIESINTLATTLDAKLAIIEAAMKAQTLALETKLGLIEAAIKALPDYTDQLKAIEAAIKGMPDYSDKLAAIETAIKNIPDYSDKMDAIEAAIKNAPDYTAALEEIKKAIAALPNYTEQLGAIITAIEALPDYSKQLEAISAAVEAIPDYSNKFDAIQTALAAIAKNIKDQQNQYADELAALTASIDAIKAAVEAQTLSQEEALAKILALLESGAIAGGGSGSGGEGGEGEGTYQSITITTSKAIGETITMTVDGELAASEVEGAVIKDSETHTNGNTVYTFELKNQTVTIKQASIEYILCTSSQITSMDFNNSPDLQLLYCYMNAIKGENMTNLVKSLPDRTGKTAGKIIVYASNDSREKNVITKADVAIAKAKNWIVLDWYDNEYEGSDGEDESTYQSITFTTSKAIGETIWMSVHGELAASEVEGADIESATPDGAYTNYRFELTSQTVTIKQASIDYIFFAGNQITSVDLNNCTDLRTLHCRTNEITGENMTDLVKDLPDRTGKTAGEFVVYATGEPNEKNVITKDDVAIAKAKNWNVLDSSNNEYEGI